MDDNFFDMIHNAYLDELIDGVTMALACSWLEFNQIVEH